jgi:serine/threonine protein kinase
MFGFEYHERTLEKLIKQRKRYEDPETQSMTEPDAWGVLSDLIHGLKSFADRGSVHGDIQPANVFVLNDKTLKLIDTSFLNDVDNAFSRRYMDFTYQSTLSPQAILSLSLGPKYAHYDLIKSDLFSIGVTALVSLTNDDFNIFYDWVNQEIQFEVIEGKLRQLLGLGYGPDLISLLRSMLERDEIRRINLKDAIELVVRGSKNSQIFDPVDLAHLDDYVSPGRRSPAQNKFFYAATVSGGGSYRRGASPAPNNADYEAANNGLYANPSEMRGRPQLQASTNTYQKGTSGRDKNLGSNFHHTAATSYQTTDTFGSRPKFSTASSPSNNDQQPHSYYPAEQVKSMLAQQQHQANQAIAQKVKNPYTSEQPSAY